MMDSNGHAPIRFRGAPKLIEGLAPLPFQEAVSSGLPLLNVKLSQQETEPEPHTLQASRAGEAVTRLGLSLPELTPPGTYEGTVKLGDQQYPVVIDVEAHPALVISPGRLSLRAAPGAEVAVDLTVSNAGNVGCEIQKIYKPGLLDVKGPERAMGVAMHEKDQQGYERMNLFAEQLASSHGGRIELLVQEGAGPLAPGELRNLHLTLRLPDRLRRGQVYAGIWMLVNRSYYLEVHVTDDEVAS